MDNQPRVCKGTKSGSSCTCDAINGCQNYSYAETNENVNNSHPHNYETVMTSTQNIQSTECSTDCVNCKLLNRLYVLLQEIVNNGKSLKHTEFEPNTNNTITRELFKHDDNKSKMLQTHNEVKLILKHKDTSKPIENPLQMTSNEDDKNFNKHNNNNEASKHFLLCNCEPPCKKKEKCSNKVNKKEDQAIGGAKKIYKCIPAASAQYWHSIGQITEQEHADFACQCTFENEDYSTQDQKTNKDERKSCNCIATGGIADSLFTQNPNLHDTMKLMPGPNIVVLTNGCSCCNKTNTPLERTSVTTNTSELVVTKSKKGRASRASAKFDNDQFLKPHKDMAPVENRSLESIKIEKSMTNGMNNDQKVPKFESSLHKDIAGIVPQEPEIIIGAALISKNAKKKSATKSKKRKNKSNPEPKDLSDKKNTIISCCQTEALIEETVICPKKTVKDASIFCEIIKSAPPLEIKCSAPTPTPTTENRTCDKCTAMQAFFTNMIEVISQLKQKTDEGKGCECVNNNNSNTSDDTNSINNDTNKNACLEIQQLAEQIAEIRLKSNQCNPPNRAPRNESKVLMNAAKASDYVLPKYTPECTEKSYCPCILNTRHDRKETYPKKKDKCKCTTNPPVKQAMRKSYEEEYRNKNSWTQEYPSTLEKTRVESPDCDCNNYNRMEETKDELFNCNRSDFPKEPDDSEMDICPNLQRMAKNYLCKTTHCFCQNEKLKEMQRAANLERLADEVINALTPCNCMPRKCSCHKTRMDPEMTHHTASHRKKSI